MIAWAAHKLAKTDTVTLSNIYAEVGPYLFGLSGSRNDVFSYQSRGVIESNIVLMTKQAARSVSRKIDKIPDLETLGSESSDGEVTNMKARALQRLKARPRPDLFGVIYAREALRTLVKAAVLNHAQGAPYEDIAKVVSPHFGTLVKGGFTYVSYYPLVMDALSSLGAQSAGSDIWVLPKDTLPPSGDEVELAKKASWHEEESARESAGAYHDFVFTLTLFLSD